MKDTFRTLSIVLLVCILLLGSVGYVRIADVHFGSEKTIGENPTPQERVAFGLEDLTRTNYRMKGTRVSTNRSSGDVWSRSRWVKRVNHNSEQIYVSEYYREFPHESLFYHYTAKRQAWRTSIDDTEWKLTPPSDTEWDRSGNRYFSSNHRIPLNASAKWRVINQTEQTVVVGIDSLEEYRHAFDISRRYRTASSGTVFVHLDRESGAIQKMVVTEVTMVDSSFKEERVPSRMKLVYEYDRSGDVSITPPEPARGFSFKGLLGDLIMY